MVPDAKIDIVPNPGNAAFRELFPEGEIESERPKYVLYFGGLEKYQGVNLLIDAAKMLEKQKDLVFLIVGSGNRREYRERAKELGMEDRILFKDRMEPKELKEYVMLSLLILPRPKHIVTEVAHPTKLVDYMLTGRPIVATDVGDARAILEKNKAGIIVEPNPGAIAEGIRFLLKNMELARQLGSNAQKLARKEYDADHLAEKLNRIYSTL